MAMKIATGGIEAGNVRSGASSPSPTATNTSAATAAIANVSNQTRWVPVVDVVTFEAVCRAVEPRSRRVNVGSRAARAAPLSWTPAR